MAPTRPTPSTPPAQNLAQRFGRLAEVWRAETAHLSSSTAIVAHPAYQEVLRLGWDVVPLLLGELAREPSLWVWALRDITGADPVPPQDRGKVAKMATAWLRWGKESGYRW